jgi:hypothetical protein
MGDGGETACGNGDSAFGEEEAGVGSPFGADSASVYASTDVDLCACGLWKY